MTFSCRNQTENRYLHVLIVIVALSLTLFAGCRDESSHQMREAPQAFLPINGYQIPILSNPDEQLSYTRSSFSDTTEKKAALEAMANLLPGARRHRGIAALELAYLRLGSDYRLASEREYQQAVEEYRKIIGEYSDMPEIRAKALWYVGWVYCDLLGETPKGLASYQDLIEQYPQEKMSLLPPAPWVSVFDQEEYKSETGQYIKSKHSWATIALIEIIRHSADDTTAWNAFQQLWQGEHHNLEIGVALKLLAGRDALVEKIQPYIHKFLESGNAGSHFKKDIDVALATVQRSKQISEDGGQQ